MAPDQWDDFAVEADMLAVASAVGVVKEPHVEPSTEEKAARADRIRAARDACERVARGAAEKGTRAREPHGGYPGARAWHQHLRQVQALDHALDHHKYPSVYELHCQTDVWKDQAAARALADGEARTRETANALAALGIPVDLVAGLLNIKPRS